MSDRISRSAYDAVVRRAPTYSTAWRITRKDGAVVSVTDHSCPVTLADGFTYLVGVAGLNSASTTEEGVGNTDQDFVSAIDESYISYEDVRTGAYDSASVVVTVFDNTNPSGEPVLVRTGQLDIVSHGKGQWRATLVGVAKDLSVESGRTLSPVCTHELGAGFEEGNPLKCTVNLAQHKDTVYTSIMSIDGVGVALEKAAMTAAGVVETEYLLIDGADLETPDGVSLSDISADFFVNGSVRVTSGANEGQSRKILSHGTLTAPATFTSLTSNEIAIRVYPAFDFPLEDNATVQVRPGCNKRLGNFSEEGNCYYRFGNSHQFNGDPLIPGSTSNLGVKQQS